MFSSVPQGCHEEAGLGDWKPVRRRGGEMIEPEPLRRSRTGAI